MVRQSRSSRLSRRKLANISDLSEELLVKIISFLPTKVAVSTSILSKQWKFLWMWCPDLQFYCSSDLVREFINKNLQLHRAPIIKKLQLNLFNRSKHADDYKTWVGIAVSRGLHELSISYDRYSSGAFLYLPSTLYTCNSLVTLDLNGDMVLVDVPQEVCLPCLKKLHLVGVTYSNEDSLRLLLCGCHVLEDLIIEREYDDNVEALVIIVPSLQRLTLIIEAGCSADECVIVTPSLKYFKVRDDRGGCSYLIEHMPLLEKADIFVLEDSYLGNLLRAISSVKRLSLRIRWNCGKEALYGDGPDGILFCNLKKLKIDILSENWSKITFRLLKDSPNLEVLDLDLTDYDMESYDEYEPVGWSKNEGPVPECLLRSLKSFKFEAWKSYAAEQEERDFLSFIIKNACCLESSSIVRS